ncbi:uncharacterized protein TNCV_2997471 [Trichonephila clavipes]|nr:uncharacterized protein TNCV_2997471 [Trichonephila clavipes]
MFRSCGQSDVKFPVLSSQASLVLILSTHGRDERLSQPRPAWDLNVGPVVWKWDALTTQHWASRKLIKFTCRNCGDRGRVAIYRPFGEVSLSLNRTVTCMVLKANDRRTSCPCHDEFRGPRSDYVRQVALATTTTYIFASYFKKLCKFPLIKICYIFDLVFNTYSQNTNISHNSYKQDF